MTDEVAHEPTPPAPAQRVRRVRRLVAGACLVVLAAWSALAFRDLAAARTEALAGLTGLESLRDRLNLDSIGDRSVVAALDGVSDRFRAAGRRANSVWTAPLRRLPWVGTQVGSIDALTAAAARTTETLSWAAGTMLEATGTGDRMEMVSTAMDTMDRTAALLEDLDLGPESGLVGPLSDARRSFATELGRLRGAIGTSAVAARGIQSFLGGPTTYVLVAANNAEMRSGSGAFLQVGTITVRDGGIHLDSLYRADELALPKRLVTVEDPDLARNWAWLAPESEWRNLAASPRFAASAALAASMWDAKWGTDVDGVLAVDPAGLQAMLAVTGPVEVDGMAVDAANVVDLLLIDQYVEDNPYVRSDRLQRIATAVFGALDRDDLDLFGLAGRLRDAAAGRHVLGWSRRADQQAGWEALGIDGSLGADSMMISILNRGANKLDPYLLVDASIDVSHRNDETRNVTVAIRVENTARPGLPRYVLGPADALGFAPGTYAGVLAVNLPGAALSPSVDGDAGLVVEGPDGPTRLVAVWVEIGAGETLETAVRFDLAASQFPITVEPSARLPAITWHFGAATWADTAAAAIDID